MFLRLLNLYHEIWRRKVTTRKCMLQVERLEDRAVPAVDIFTVNTTLDVPDDQLDGQLMTLRRAIELGDASSDPEVAINFNLPAGSVISIGNNNSEPTLSALPEFSTAPNTTKDFAVIGLGTSDLTIQRNQSVGDFRIFFVNPSVSVNFYNLSVCGGSAAAGDYNGWGGGILNYGGTVNLYNVAVYENGAVSGGGIANLGSLSVDNTSVYSNNATETGGGILNAGQAWVQNESQVMLNTADRGGGIYSVSGGSQLTIDTDSMVFHNTAISWGGGIASFGTLNMNESQLLGNSAPIAGGLESAGTTTLSYVIIEFNSATDGIVGDGGGIRVSAGSTTLTTGCTVSYNTAGWNGGGDGICCVLGAILVPNFDNNDITDVVVNENL